MMELMESDIYDKAKRITPLKQEKITVLEKKATDIRMYVGGSLSMQTWRVIQGFNKLDEAMQLLIEAIEHD